MKAYEGAKRFHDNYWEVDTGAGKLFINGSWWEGPCVFVSTYTAMSEGQSDGLTADSARALGRALLEAADRLERRPCRNCDNSGMEGSFSCPECKGTGWLVE